MSSSLYDRLGGMDAINQIACDIVDLHVANPLIGKRFVNADADALKRSVAAFLSSGSGGPDIYTGADMHTVHARMNIEADELLAVLDNVVAALKRNQIALPEIREVLFILYGMKEEVLRI
ncbi:group I truncated hemoglobin [Motiliproteus sediminis]|uniref:group I truncated hemoglobin n=1 Tax=Motiliproteus sediminis TaxID=1468178 RepID=UPI001AEF8B4C|nr:group 1 truncated hemoglobin [Motiliproteus sediminis]